MAVASQLMYFCYGAHTHPRGEVNLVNMETRALKNRRNQTWGKQRIMHISGEMIYDPDHAITDPQAQFDDRITEMEIAYSTNFQTAVLKHTDGTDTQHIITSELGRDSSAAFMASGTQVDYVSFPRRGGDEYATVRTFAIRLSAIYTDWDGEIQDFQESVEQRGKGEPVWRWAIGWRVTGIQSVVGQQPNPVVNPFLGQQVIRPVDPIIIIQQGSRTAMSTWPLAPSPYLPDWEHTERRVISQDAPRNQGLKYTHFTRRWRYVFEAPPDSGGITPGTP